MSGMVPYINKIILIPSSHPLYHCCHSSLICKYTKACVCIKSNTHYCYYYFKHSSLLAQLRRSIKILILSSLFPSLKFILSLCRSKFLTYIIFLLSEELPLTFLARQVYWQKNSLHLVLLLLFFSHSVTSVMTVMSVTSDSATSRLQHTRLLCPSPSPRACSNSCLLSW